MNAAECVWDNRGANTELSHTLLETTHIGGERPAIYFASSSRISDMIHASS